MSDPVPVTRPGEAASPFGIRGVSHLALVCSDMAATVDFYNGVLGLPLVLTQGRADESVEQRAGSEGERMARGLQHFFFDMGNGDTLAFFWFPNGVPAAPGTAYPETTVHTSADGSMHHLALEIASDKLADVWKRLEEKNVPFFFFAHSIEEIESYREDAGIDLAESAAAKLPDSQELIGAKKTPVHTLDAVNENTYLASFYFTDPDGINLELAAWCEPGYSKARAARPELAMRSGGRPKARVMVMR